MVVEKQVHYGTEVWTNVGTDRIRREQCLCLNCGKMKPGCAHATKLFEVCVEGDIALMVTRCKNYEPKG